MNKQFLRGIAVLVLGGLIASCSEDFDNTPIVEQKKEAYQQVFKKEFGSIDPSHTWGFDRTGVAAASRLGTRADEPERPEAGSFRDTKPAKPTLATFSNTTPSDAVPAKNLTQDSDWKNDMVVRIDESNVNGNTNRERITVYATGNITFNGSLSDKNCNIVVTENSTLTLQAIPNNLYVYLAPGATLNLPSNATFQKSHAGIYMSKDSRVVGQTINFVEDAQVINDGGTITATNLYLNKSSLWNEGTVSVSGILQGVNQDELIYNAPNHTISVGTLDMKNNGGLLYNEGTAVATTSITLRNTSAELVNKDSLSAPSVTLDAGAKMHNDDGGIVNIAGATKITNSNCYWTNDGHYTSGSFEITAYSVSNYNNCYLEVLNDFHLNRGGFVLNGGASVVTRTFTWEDTSNFWMGSESLLKVREDMLTKNYNSGFGFRGPKTGEYAVIQAHEIRHEGEEQFRISYYGNLYVDTQNHFAQWYKDAPSNTNQPCYYYEPSVRFGNNEKDCPVRINSGACNPGYNNDIEIPIFNGQTQTKIEYWLKRELVGEPGRVFCEDLGRISSNDLDFNDVVFDAYVYKVTYITRTIVSDENGTVTTTDVETSTIYETAIVLLAAGGTLPLTVAGVEVHQALANASTSTIINTIENNEGSYGNTYLKDVAPVRLTSVDAKGNSINVFPYSSIEAIPIKVKQTDIAVLELSAEPGDAPHKICVPVGTKWAKERIKLRDAYPSFADYVRDHTVQFWTTGIAENLYTSGTDYPVLPVVGMTKLRDGESTTSSANGGYNTGDPVLSRKNRK
jgi:hypothetical protein